MVANADLINRRDLAGLIAGIDPKIIASGSGHPAFDAGARAMAAVSNASTSDQSKQAYASFQKLVPSLRDDAAVRDPKDNIVWTIYADACGRRRYYSRRVERAQATACPYNADSPDGTPQRPRSLDDAKPRLAKAETATSDAELALSEGGDSNPELSKAVSYVRYCRGFLRDDAEAKTQGQVSLRVVDPDTGNTCPCWSPRSARPEA